MCPWTAVCTSTLMDAMATRGNVSCLLRSLLASFSLLSSALYLLPSRNFSSHNLLPRRWYHCNVWVYILYAVVLYMCCFMNIPVFKHNKILPMWWLQSWGRCSAQSSIVIHNTCNKVSLKQCLFCFLLYMYLTYLIDVFCVYTRVVLLHLF